MYTRRVRRHVDLRIGKHDGKRTAKNVVAIIAVVVVEARKRRVEESRRIKKSKMCKVEGETAFRRTHRPKLRVLHAIARNTHNFHTCSSSPVFTLIQQHRVVALRHCATICRNGENDMNIERRQQPNRSRIR